MGTSDVSNAQVWLYALYAGQTKGIMINSIRQEYLLSKAFGLKEHTYLVSYVTNIRCCIEDLGFCV